jgi:eukaryotic-like serine/threonine-protein kinase
MSLSPGTAFGPYRVLDKLGEGGMGEVYRAHDTRLDRDVAIKVLPATFAGDPERRARFEREARAVAALSHPNIVAIFDTGVHDGQLFVVTELLDGETLRERLASAAAAVSESGSRTAANGEMGSSAPVHEGAALSLRKAVDIAVQIARGLAAAHAKGLVHRDLKPENVFLLDDGQVKILDFGLALQTAGSGETATRTAAALTGAGTVMGTVGYMAPEQVRGQAVDARTDLFALGAVVYEMLAGRRAFTGGTAADTMTAILTQEPPDLATARPDVPPALDRIVRHALEKNPNERFQTARDVAFALEALSGPATAETPALAPAPPRRRGLRIAIWAAALAAAAAAGMWLQVLRAPPSPVQYAVKTFERQVIFNARFMPDGETLVYSAANQGTTPAVFILHPDSVAPDQIAGPGTHLLAVSSRGELAVLTGATFLGHRLFAGTLARMVPGASPRPWLEHVREADWSPDGQSLAVIRDLGNGSDRLEYPVGTTLYEARGYLSDPRVSRDGRRVAFVEHPFRFDDRGAVKVADTAGHVQALTDQLWGVEGLAWSADDARVLFSSADQTMETGIPFEPFSVPSDGGHPPRVALPTIGWGFVHDVSRSGTWLLTREDLREGFVVKRPDGDAERDLSWLDLSFGAALSPDGETVVLSDENLRAGRSYAVMIRHTDGSPPIRLGEGSAQTRGLSPDGKWVAASLPAANQFVFYPTGAGDARRLPVRPDQFQFQGWFPDSQHVLLCGSASASAPRCYRQATSGGAPVPVGPDSAVGGAVAPDGAMVFQDDARTDWLYPANGGPRRPLVTPDAEFAGWSTPTSAFFVRPSSDGTLRIDRFDAATGKNTLAAVVAEPDRTGLVSLHVVMAVGTAGHYGYLCNYTRQFSTLLTASGVRVR